ncbi:MAG: KH domain-containing protein [Armatimonadetes bacterium]|nr:KH domain-containing protein [Armatimonadota bacterium]
MQDLVEYIAKALVDNPDEVRVNRIEGETVIIFEVQVAPEDLGKIIGRQGRIANALRTLVKAAASRQGKKATVEILS